MMAQYANIPPFFSLFLRSLLELNTPTPHQQAHRFLESEWGRRHAPHPPGFLTVRDVTASVWMLLLEEGIRFKTNPTYRAGALEGQSVALLFQKTSTRTRCSFEIGSAELGAVPVVIDWRSSNFTLSALEDESAVLSRYCDLIVARVYHHSDLVTMQQHSRVPVVNGLCDLHHPCQALADMMTIRCVFGTCDVNLLYVGDGNNVCHSLIQATVLTGARMRVITPPHHAPDPAILAAAGDRVSLSHTMSDEAFAWADAVYTDTWVSMGQEDQSEARMATFMSYQVSAEWMAKAPAHAVFMHCLPAHRGMEVTADVLDGRQSIVLDQAENRKHAQKALLCHLLT